MIASIFSFEGVLIMDVERYKGLMSVSWKFAVPDQIPNCIQARYIPNEFRFDCFRSGSDGGKCIPGDCKFRIPTEPKQIPPRSLFSFGGSQ